MYRVPPSRPHRVFYALQPWLAALLVLPALLLNGMIIFEEIGNAKRYGSGELTVALISAFAIFWALVLAYAVAKYRPRWQALLRCACIVLLDLASIGWWMYMYSFVQQ